MTEHGIENEARCPGCPRHCLLSSPGCVRGEAYARGENPPKPEDIHHHGPEDGPEHGLHPHHGPENGPERGLHPHHGPEHGPEGGPHPHHGPGPHGRGPGRPPRPEPPEPEPDRDSLLGLMRRCGHYLAHRAGAVSSRERMLRLLSERGQMAQSDFVQLLDLRSASVSEQLGKLEGQGLIERRRSEEDRRGFTIELTEAGQELARSLPEGGADVFSALDESERERLTELLKKLLADWEN